MGLFLADDLLPGAGVHPHGDQIAHRAGGHINSRFAPEDFRGSLLQPVHRGVFAIDVIADLCLRHGAPHLRRGLGDGVAAQSTGGITSGLFSVAVALLASGCSLMCSSQPEVARHVCYAVGSFRVRSEFVPGESPPALYLLNKASSFFIVFIASLGLSIILFRTGINCIAYYLCCSYPRFSAVHN